MHKFKRLAAFMLAAVMISTASTNVVMAQTAVQINNNTWTMSSHTKQSNIAADFEWNGLKIAANSSKTATFDGTYLKLAGGANTISFKVASPCTITVSAKNNSTSVVRYAQLKDSSNKELGKIELPITTADTTCKYTYTGLGEELTLAPSGGGISIKSIAINYNNKNHKKGDINGDGNIDSRDAAAALRHIAGLTPIAGAVEQAAANGNNDGQTDIRDAVWILSNKYEAPTEVTTVQAVDTSDGIEVRSYDELVSAMSSANTKAYVMNDIKMGDRLQLSKGGQAVIGVPKADGTLPVLDFQNMTGGKDIVNSSSSDSDVGVRINSANNTIKNLVVEKAHDNGIQIKGTGALNNTVENCIVRYNNDSGIQVTGGASGNTLKGVYSYRNCDVYTLGGNADGFAIKLSAGPEETADTSVMDKNKNVCIDCYAWENGDDGWDSFDYPAAQQNFNPNRWTYRIDYTNCMCWSNGTPANCLGYNDYVNGLPLDENLPFISRFKVVNPTGYQTFMQQYNEGTLCSRTASASTYYGRLDTLIGAIPTTSGSLTASQIASSGNWQGNPNGFKLGSAYTQANSQRYMYNCITFDHDSVGFDKNNSGAEIWAENCISFNNKINYKLDKYTAKKWTNIFGWNGSSKDTLPTGGSAPSTNGSSDRENEVRSAAQRIIGYAQANKQVASSVFELVF